MANPQKENGYTSIANEILEALARIRINGEARQVLDVIFRKTYGFNKKEDKISLSQFVLATSLTKQSVCRALKRLISMRIIIKIDNEDIQTYRFNKDFDTWKALSKLLKGVAVSPTSVIKIDNGGVAVSRHTKESITKDTITKERIQQNEFCGNEINELISLFGKINPTINYGNTTHRKAIQEMLRKFGKEKLEGAIKYAVSVQGQQYAPVITTPTELKNNLGKLLIYHQRESSPKKGGITFI